MTIYKKWKDKYLNLIQKISNRRGWNASDCNPFFYIIFDHLHKSNALNLIQKISNRRGWNASDCNPFFYIIFDHLHKSNALSLREFKKQLKQKRKG
jgi:hypothetical protein